MKNRAELIQGYNLIARPYAERYGRELDYKPFDRDLLRRFARGVPAPEICDLGCGSGHIAAHLQALGLKAMGIDLSSGMVDVARRSYPEVRYEVGDMLDLDLGENSLGGIVALYSIIHLRREDLARAFRGMARVLKPKGLLLVAFHRGQGELHEDEELGLPVSFDCTLFEPDEVAGAMAEAGLEVVETAVRRPYKEEYQTRRVYILAEKIGDVPQSTTPTSLAAKGDISKSQPENRGRSPKYHP
jgi:SAM-dependent methyltransferase